MTLNPIRATSRLLPASRALAGLLGTALLAMPIVAAAAEPASHYHHHVWGKTAADRDETIEQRIAMLHTSLQITPGEEPDWHAVADVMRGNETRMQDMISAREAEPVHHVDAIEDLRTYEHFTAAHVEGLRALRTSFETLYATMPASQKLVADDVFDKFGNGHD